MAFVEEIEGLRESKQNDQIDDAEGKHVTGDHRINHGHEWSSQSNGSTEEKRQAKLG